MSASFFYTPAAPLAEALALDSRSADFSGFVISSMMGAGL